MNEQKFSSTFNHFSKAITMLPLLQKLKKLEKHAFSKLSPTTPPETEIPMEPLPMEYSEEDLKKSIAAKLQGYRPVDKEANFTGPRYMG